ncbi:MAG: exo-alpha-sialidase [Gemmatimonadetes bacterium]|nr:exo-alpha-sialidase [Gemmatimonadota bacterium]
MDSAEPPFVTRAPVHWSGGRHAGTWLPCALTAMGSAFDIDAMAARVPALLFLASLLAACAQEAEVPVLGAREIESPAGPESGEPFLSADGDRVYLSWLERAEGGHDLQFADYQGGQWSQPRRIAWSDRFFVNWADFPSLAPGADGSLWAHWLERGEAGGYDYGVRVVRSADGGATWSAPWTPHDDASPTEHGFVASLPIEGAHGFVWLDGRRYAPGPGGEQATEEMTLYFRAMGADGPSGPETLVDARVCDCCQTDAALTAAGPVVVYRDRSPEEIRDIYMTRWVDGAWTEGKPVHADGWETGACPVNGPAVAAQGNDVAVAWFTAAEDVPRVKVAFSHDAGERFGEPVLVDAGNPSGRVDLLMRADGSVLVSWLERVGEDRADVLVRLISPNGRAGEPVTVSASSSERASGFPRIIATAEGNVLVAWTDVAGLAPTVRMAVVEVAAP